MRRLRNGRGTPKDVSQYTDSYIYVEQPQLTTVYLPKRLVLLLHAIKVLELPTAAFPSECATLSVERNLSSRDLSDTTGDAYQRGGSYPYHAYDFHFCSILVRHESSSPEPNRGKRARVE